MEIRVNTSSFEEAWDLIVQFLPFIIPLVLIQLGLIAFVIIDIARKGKTKNLSPLIWILISLFLSNLGIGSILYIILGRSDSSKNDDI